MPGHTRAQCTLGKMSKSQLPSQRHMHSAQNKHLHYCIRTTAGIHPAAGCSGLGVMYRFSNKNSSPSAMTSRLPHCRGHPPALVGNLGQELLGLQVLQQETGGAGYILRRMPRTHSVPSEQALVPLKSFCGAAAAAALCALALPPAPVETPCPTRGFISGPGLSGSAVWGETVATHLRGASAPRTHQARSWGCLPGPIVDCHRTPVPFSPSTNITASGQGTTMQHHQTSEKDTPLQSLVPNPPGRRPAYAHRAIGQAVRSTSVNGRGGRRTWSPERGAVWGVSGRGAA